MSFWMFIASGALFFFGFLLMIPDPKHKGGGAVMVGFSGQLFTWALLVRILEHLP